MMYLKFSRIVFILLLTGLSCQLLFAQDNHQPENHQPDNHVHEHEHKHHPWEIGGAIGAVFNFQEKHIAPGIHAHVLRNLGEEKKFGVGIGFETILDEHRHLNFGIPLNYNTHKGLIFTATPGVLIKKETDWEVKPSVHFETLYEFDFDRVHMGPMFELALAPNDFHLMLGIHLGFGW